MAYRFEALRWYTKSCHESCGVCTAVSLSRTALLQFNALWLGKYPMICFPFAPVKTFSCTCISQHFDTLHSNFCRYIVVSMETQTKQHMSDLWKLYHIYITNISMERRGHLPNHSCVVEPSIWCDLEIHEPWTCNSSSHTALLFL